MSSALIAMSGGVDSSVAALLALKQGLNCVGAMMKLFQNEESEANCNKTCCSLEDANDARSVAFKLGIPFHVFNFMDYFKINVIDRFINSYQSGETPNPCIECNRYLKFDKLLKRAHELHLDYLITGHYARIQYNKGSNRYLLKKGVDASKDQSYVLYMMTQYQLEHTLFPLGNLTKKEVREIAVENGFINAKKHESQDICFVPSGNYAEFIKKHSNQNNSLKPGSFMDIHGNIIGEHKGIIHYTIGQRKGLGISSENSLYVCKINADDNSITIGNENSLYSKTILAKNINLIPMDRLNSPIKVTAKLRYKQPEQPATLHQLDENTLRAEFETPQRAVTKGQAVVFYDGDIVIGGGTIA